MKHRQSKSKLSYLLLTFVILCLILLFLLFTKSRRPSDSLIIHGPHFAKPLADMEVSTNILGTHTRRQIRPTSTLSPKPIPTATIVPTPQPTPVSLQNAQFGIAAGGGLTGMEQNLVDQYFQQLSNLGVKWVRWDANWGVIQADGPNAYNWVGTDRVAAAAHKFGINSLVTIDYTPTWAQLPSCKGTFACAPSDPNTFGAFAKEVARRYSPQDVNKFEIWNEPNINMFWKPAPNVENYLALLRSAYVNIKSVNPNAIVLVGGLSPSDDSMGHISPINFIQNLYQLSSTKDFDGIALHPYSYPVVASYQASWNSWQQIDTIRSLMDTRGDSAKPLWVTEYGAATGGPGRIRDINQLDFTYGLDYLSESAQNQLMQNVLASFKQLRGPKGPFFWYSFVDVGISKETPENFFGLLRYDWSKKPAYDTFRNAIIGK